MKTQLVITDLTRMHHGKVCIAGYTLDHRCIRPVLPPPGIPESALRQGMHPIIFPFALIEIDLDRPSPQPPHTEDYFYVAKSTKLIQQIQDRREVLSWSFFDNVASIFEQPVHRDFGFYVMDCQGPRSLGTIRPRGIAKVTYETGEEGTWDYRLSFFDRQGEFYRLKITDLTLHRYCNSQRCAVNDPAEIATQMTQKLKSSQVYLRIGLARGWNKFPDRCYLQITSIYTFPDYLEGKTFADFV